MTVLGSTLLLLIGSMPTALSVEIVEKQSEEHLISLRDYDFVGEDKRLAMALAARMAVLQAPLRPEPPARAHSPLQSPALPAASLRPDLLALDLHRYPRVNVSLDYGELFPAADLSLEANSSWLAPPGPPAASRVTNLTANLTASRRAPEYLDPSFYEYNLKILDIMRQKVYTVQGKLIEIEPVIKKYEGDPRFRMAYIFSRLDGWLKDLRSLYYAMRHVSYMRFKRRLWYYEHALRRNIDITYSVEYLVHLHAEYIKKMEEILPTAKREELRKAQRERQRMLEMHSKNPQNPTGRR